MEKRRGTMLERDLEPEVMDQPAEAQEYDAMDHREVNERFVADLLDAGLRAMAAEAGEPVETLDLGSGTALIPIELCRREPNVRVAAVDLAESMLDLARANIEVAALADRVALDRVDAKALPYDEGQFDCVVSNTLVHHIPEPKQSLAEALRVLRPGGLLFVRDLARPESEEELAALVETYCGESTARQRKLLADSLRAGLAVDEIRRIVESWNAPAESVQLTSDRHWTWTFIKPPAA
jgi:ubiquinone/menaquinone biosynthesis C-methylase UbiE